MNIRLKIILSVLPLIIVPLLLTGTASFLAARNGITSIATRFLRFKAEELEKYADSQWALLEENNLSGEPLYVEITQSAVASFARSLVRSGTELILALDPNGAVVMQTGEVPLAPEEEAGLRRIAAERRQGWMQVPLGGVARVVQAFPFAPFSWHLLVTERRDAFYAAVDRIFYQTGVILLGASLASLALLLVLTYYITSPLRGVIAAMRRIITGGDLTGRVAVLYRDETGELGHTFNLMTGELEKAYERIKGYALRAVVAQKKEQKIRHIFQKYVPKDVIDRYFENPESMLVGENRILAILFSDIRSFATISEKMMPDEIVESLNAYFSRMVDIIMNHQGIVDKYIGDAIMAFFGAPVRHPDDAIQAVRSGLEMLEVLKEFNRQQARKGRAEFRIGIGINYGEATVGNIGSEKKMDYTVIGDMVNLASRLEGLTKFYKVPIIVSESMCRNIQKEIPCRLIDRVAVKGRSLGVGIYIPSGSLPPREEQAWKLHQEAMERYFQRQFREAARVFQEVGRLLPGDPVASLFAGRCAGFIAAPPPESWTGVTVMDQK
jgi:class 3 adenylate cyclase/HAMP domain-containing protein